MLWCIMWNSSLVHAALDLRVPNLVNHRRPISIKSYASEHVSVAAVPRTDQFLAVFTDAGMIN